MRYAITICTALILSATAAFAANPAGQYTVTGANPGGNGKYSGTAKTRELI